MSSLKTSRWILTCLFLGFALSIGYGSYHYYIHLCKAERLNFVEYRNQLTTRIYQRLQAQWDLELKRMMEHARRSLDQSGGQYSKALQLIHDSRNEIFNAFYIDHQMIYLPEWKKSLAVQSSEDLSFDLMENPEFKQAEILEYQYQNFTDAVKIYERFWLENPNNFQAANALARCCFKMQDYDRAEKIYLQIYAQNPDIVIEGDVPLALIAAFQLLGIYAAIPSVNKTQSFGLELFNALLDDRWELSKPKADFFKAKLRAYLAPGLTDPLIAKTFRYLEWRERSLEKSKTYVRWICKQIIPLIEGSQIRDYKIYSLDQQNRQSSFLLLFPYRQGTLIIELGYPEFAQNSLSPLMQSLANDNGLGIALHYAAQTIAFPKHPQGETRSYLLSRFFPDLSLDLIVPAQAATAVEQHLHRLKHYFITGFCLLLTLLLLVYLALMKQIQFAELKSDFVSHVSHELKTPLTSLRMFSEMLQSHPRLPLAKRSQYYAIMQEESIRLSRLIENLLDVARIERKKSNFHFKSENLESVIQTALELFTHSLKTSHKLKVHLQRDLRLPLDKDAIIQLVLNLLDNAQKFSPPHSNIRLDCRRQGSQILLQIQDQGSGMPRAELRKVFNKFYQSKKSYNDRFKGVGLGLAIVKSIAQAHGAKITITSELQHGTTVTVSFPCPSRS